MGNRAGLAILHKNIVEAVCVVGVQIGGGRGKGDVTAVGGDGGRNGRIVSHRARGIGGNEGGCHRARFVKYAIAIAVPIAQKDLLGACPGHQIGC